MPVLSTLGGPKGVCGINAMAGFWLGARAILGGLLRPIARRSWRSATNDSCRIRADNFDGIERLPAWHCPNFNAKEAWKLPIYHIPSSILVSRVIKL